MLTSYFHNKIELNQTQKMTDSRIQHIEEKLEEVKSSMQDVKEYIEKYGAKKKTRDPFVNSVEMFTQKQK